MTNIPHVRSVSMFSYCTVYISIYTVYIYYFAHESARGCIQYVASKGVISDADGMQPVTRCMHEVSACLVIKHCMLLTRLLTVKIHATPQCVPDAFRSLACSMTLLLAYLLQQRYILALLASLASLCCGARISDLAHTFLAADLSCHPPVVREPLVSTISHIGLGSS